MTRDSFNYERIILLFLFICIILIGCENKTEKSEEQKREVISDESMSDNYSSTKDSDVQEPISIPNIKGTWNGTFDDHSATLKITEQTDSNFYGNITINYRQVIHQEVKGSFSPTTLSMTMTDQLHSRYEGKYNGKLSKDFFNYSGTFTMKVDGKQFSYNLNKK